MKAFVTALAAGLVVSGAAFAAGNDMAGSAPSGKEAGYTPMRVSGRTAARDTEALNLLEGQGYTDFTDFRPDGQDFDATVTQNGKTFAVKIDPDSGRITRG